MKILKEELGYVIENSHEIKNNEEIADILSSFLDEDSLLIFSCIDTEYFLNNLQNEDKKTQEFYRKLIEFNKRRGHGILRDDDDEREKTNFIKERTVFINNESDLPAQYPSHKKRRTIWYKTLNKSEIIKAINIDQLFKCIVLKKGKDFYEYNYAIKQYETEEGKNLFITEKEVGNFEKYVYPIICNKNIL
ncbi:hypothetical protein [Clostridium weizhouense]|uniref:Uncharacterized protein n=1 Tax=Clostridium weizhouense TaxID=2859781 RepID=A0ABS7ATC4_9CLOT|nr:hypothetical protein [Clostridium weizhouense]MBW6411932.1 hypothetical protein [Clostridium weizhouense]